MASRHPVAGGGNHFPRLDNAPSRNGAEAFPRSIREELRRNRARADSQPGCHRSRAVPLLLRRALHARLPHAHRRSRLHQEDFHRQSARLRARDSFREYSRPQLRARLPHGSALRGRLRDARKGRGSPSKSAACSATPSTTFWITRSSFSSAGAPNGKRVACIGAGPASLACAAELAQVGLRRNDLRSERTSRRPEHLWHRRVQNARRRFDSRSRISSKQLGVKFRQNTEVGRDISFADLEKQFDAIFIGVGLGRNLGRSSCPAKICAACYGAIEFIEKTKVQPFARSRSRPPRRLHRRGQHRH